MRRIKVTDACQSLIGTFSTLRRCVVFGRMLQIGDEQMSVPKYMSVPEVEHKILGR